MIAEERKENIKRLFNELSNLPEQDKLEEFAGFVYAKCAIMHLIEIIKEHYKNPETLEKEAANWSFLTKVVNVATTYSELGLELGYITKNEDKNVSE